MTIYLFIIQRETQIFGILFGSTWKHESRHRWTEMFQLENSFAEPKIYGKRKALF